jgi:hypothetical protein
MHQQTPVRNVGLPLWGLREQLGGRSRCTSGVWVRRLMTRSATGASTITTLLHERRHRTADDVEGNGKRCHPDSSPDEVRGNSREEPIGRRHGLQRELLCEDEDEGLVPLDADASTVDFRRSQNRPTRTTSPPLRGDRIALDVVLVGDEEDKPMNRIDCTFNCAPDSTSTYQKRSACYVPDWWRYHAYPTHDRPRGRVEDVAAWTPSAPPEPGSSATDTRPEDLVFGQNPRVSMRLMYSGM